MIDVGTNEYLMLIIKLEDTKYLILNTWTILNRHTPTEAIFIISKDYSLLIHAI